MQILVRSPLVFVEQPQRGRPGDDEIIRSVDLRDRGKIEAEAGIGRNQNVDLAGNSRAELRAARCPRPMTLIAVSAEIL
jgi:hypothetical protein